MTITFHPDGRVTGLKLRQSGMVLQVQNIFRSNADSYTINTNFQDVSGYSISITPTAVDSKIILTGTIPMRSLDVHMYGRFVRNIGGGSYSVPTGWVGDAAGSNRIRSMFGSGYRLSGAADQYSHSPIPVHLVDTSHNTTGTLNYKFQIRTSTSSHYTVYFGRNDNDADNTSNTRSQGQLTLMEIAA